MNTALLSPTSAPATANRVRCAFTVDVEDWYQSSVDFDAPIHNRVQSNVEQVLTVLDDCGVKGTFFVQGLVAKAFPKMLRDLVAAGHEIQSHGYSHRPLFGMNRGQLRAELVAARESVVDACGVQVTAFRAPDFSIRRDNLWALEVLAETGFTVDSSIFPIQMSRYGIDGWATVPQQVPLANGQTIWEVPVAVWPVAFWRLPVAGGGYFRLLPSAVLERAFRSLLARREPVVVYCHPYEFNPGELKEYRGRVSPWFLAKQGLGRGRFVKRVRHLLTALPFGRFDEVLAGWGVR
jgi:polysaccharide deacetylase family protein (PEP-CTERM system associated)